MYSINSCQNLPYELSSQYLLVEDDLSAQASEMDFTGTRLRSMGDFFTSFPLLQSLALGSSIEIVYDNSTFDGLVELVNLVSDDSSNNSIKNANLEFMDKLEKIQLRSPLPESFDFKNHPNLKSVMAYGTRSEDFKNICTAVKDSLESLTVFGNSSNVLAKPFQKNCFSNFTKLQVAAIHFLDIEGAGLMGSPVLTSVTLDSSNAGPEEFSD
eukprot:Nk52_evm1s917 gene=Nk52_evmTU1s917